MRKAESAQPAVVANLYQDFFFFHNFFVMHDFTIRNNNGTLSEPVEPSLII